MKKLQKYLEDFNKIFFLSFHTLELTDQIQKSLDRTSLPPSLQGACFQRQYEYLGGRYCARKVIESQGETFKELLKDRYGRPIWPTSLVGSLSHTGNKICAVAVKKSYCYSIGIDLERKNRLSQLERVEKKFLTQYEMNYDYGGRRDVILPLFFSIKESIYKCFSWILKQNIKYTHICLLKVNWEKCSYYFQLNDQIGVKKHYKGYFYHDKNLVFTLVFMVKLEDVWRPLSE